MSDEKLQENTEKKNELVEENAKPEEKDSVVVVAENEEEQKNKEREKEIQKLAEIREKLFEPINENIKKEAEKLNSEGKPKYVPYTPVNKKDRAKAFESMDVEAEFNKLKTKKRKKVALIIALIVLILIALAFSTVFAMVNSKSDKMLTGVTIRNIAVGGLTKDETIKLLNDSLDEEKKKEIKLKIDDEEVAITLEQIGIEYKIEEAVEKAYNIGRDGNVFQNNFTIIRSSSLKPNVDLEVEINENALDSFVKSINVRIPNAMADNSYSIEDDELVITRGSAGLVADTDKIKAELIEAATTGIIQDIVVQTKEVECPDIDIEKIYQEVYQEPKDAYYTKEPFQVFPHQNGIDFDLEAAKEMLKEIKDEYVIELKIVKPNVLTSEIGTEAFPDLLATFSTKYDSSNTSRSTNLRLAASKINGAVVMPGEVFSYNKTVGKRTEEAGYKDANGFSGGRVVPMLGGGICQVSSTLYDAILYANLNVIERYNHMFQATYVEPGKDATVVWGSLDFKFENTRKNPVMIKAYAQSGHLQVDIYGIKEEVEYDIEILSVVHSWTPWKTITETDNSLAPGQTKVTQNGIQGCKSTTYRIRRKDGVEVNREVLSTDVYDAQPKVVKQGPAVTSTTPTTPTTPTTTPEPSKPVQEKPTTTPPTTTTPSTPTNPPDTQQTPPSATEQPSNPTEPSNPSGTEQAPVGGEQTPPPAEVTP